MTRLCLILGFLAAAATLQTAPSQPDFIGAPEPPKVSEQRPRSPAEEQALFTLPPGFEIELVASESEGIGKFVAVYWDQRGRMWSMTALEYPVDANESPAAAKALYESIARDKVLVWDQPFGPGPHTPRVFAEGLAIPLGILPYQNGVYVQHGPNIDFLEDTNDDGRADHSQTILTGFGVQDSHLFPHQFTRAPGNWIWMAQGAFNYGKIRTTTGAELQFDQTRMARFRPDGSDFDITSQGPCNIWGLVLTAEGEAFIQEANDYGYPLMPFHEHANYPGCSNGQFKSYAPEFPGTAPHFQMGGTGLSGLALSDVRGAWPEPYAGIFYVANPITRMIQAIRVHRYGPRYRLEKLPDFIRSADEMFRPVAIAFGPDGCLYIVDWYNKIISHNEVPRTHPERDKKRGRIWRVKHKDQVSFQVPDFTKLPAQELLVRLGSDSLAQHHLAWQAIADRKLTGLAPELTAILADPANSTARRTGALWALEALGALGLETLQPLLGETNRNLRREAVRAFSESSLEPEVVVAALTPLAEDSDPEVRAQVIRTAGALAARTPDAVALCIQFALPALDEPTGRSTQNGRTIKIGEAYEREFERYLVRLFLEQSPEATAAFLDSEAAADLAVENRLVAALSLEPADSAPRVARLLSEAARPPNEEELLRMAPFSEDPQVKATLRAALENPRTQLEALERLLSVRTRLDPVQIAPLVGGPAHNLWHTDEAGRNLSLRLIASFKISEMELELVESLADENSAEQQIAVLRALREIGSTAGSQFAELAASSSNAAVREEALAALAASPGPHAPRLLLKLLPEVNHLHRRRALDRLASNPAGARALVAAVGSGDLSVGDMDAALLQKLQTILPNDTQLAAMTAELKSLFRPVLRLDGSPEAWLDTKIHLEGSFTLETWIRLDPGIDNSDGILGAPGVVDMNFHDGRFRVWVAGRNDVIVARKQLVPESWTHLALTRDAEGLLHIYLNGELDTSGEIPVPEAFRDLRLGWTTPQRGTQGWLAEYRVWDHARSEAEIRAHFDQTFEPSEKPQGLRSHFTGAHWPKLRPGAGVQLTGDFPALLSPDEARAQAARFEKFRQLARAPGDPGHGQTIFASACQVCHTVAGQGGQIGPVLNGAGAMGTEALLRAVLTPNAAMEAGYRTFRIELQDGELLDGMLVAQDDQAILIRQPNAEDRRIPQNEIRRASFLKTSLMPEGLFESLPPEAVADLLAYLKTLK